MSVPTLVSTPALSTSGLVEVRPARVDDLEAVEWLLARSFGQSAGSAFAGLPADVQVRLLVAVHKLHAGPTDGVFVAADGASIVGVGSLVTAETVSLPGLTALRVLRPLGVRRVVRFYANVLGSAYWPAADEAYIFGLAVAPTHRRRGLGERLLRAAEEESSRRGKRILSVLVAPTNRASRSLCERQGFRVQLTAARRWRRLISRRRDLLLRKELR